MARTATPKTRPGASTADAGPIAEARHTAGLSQRELADRIGVPLWTVARIEKGNEDPAPHLAAIAAVTGQATERLLEEPIDAAAANGPPAEETAGSPAILWVRNLILGSIVLLVTIRFFAEDIGIFPRSVKLVDIPILLGLLVLYWVAPRARPASAMSTRYLVPAILFLMVCVVSVIVNPGRTEPGPVLLFVYGFLGPILVFHIVRTLWPPGNALALSQVLVGLAGIQLVVVFAVDLPQYIAEKNPDLVTGTFGDNAYQLVFFLLICTALVATIATVERGRLAARLAPLFFVATAGAILLAQYRALLLTAALAVVLITVLLGLVRVRGALAGVLLACAFVAGLSAIPSIFPELRIQATVNTLTGNPGSYIKARVDAGADIPEIYTDELTAIAVGAGPGTVNSRAWQTYYQPGQSIGLAMPFLVGDGQTDFAAKYTIPRQENTGAVEGSYIIANPFASYYALLAEVGLLGFVLMAAIYGRALVDSIRNSLTSLRNARNGDPLPGLFLASAAGFFVIIQMAILDNWWEVTRLTFIVWTIFAVATKEFEARSDDGTLEPAATA